MRSDPSNRKRRRHFGYLTAVVLVIGIFYAATNTPHINSKPIRGPVSRARTNMRYIALALENYVVDSHVYPPMHSFDASSFDPERIHRRGGAGLSFIEPGGNGVSGLTTPLAYVTSLLSDPFAPIEGMPFAYWAPANGRAEVNPADGGTTVGWILISPGPDEDYNLTPADLPTAYDPIHSGQPSDVLLAGGGARGAYTYDPTNGIVSAGDLWRVKQ